MNGNGRNNRGGQAPVGRGMPYGNTNQQRRGSRGNTASAGQYGYGKNPSRPNAPQSRPQRGKPRTKTREDIMREQAIREQKRREAYETRKKQAELARQRKILEEKIKREKKIRRRENRKLFRARALVCLMMFVVLAAVTAGIITLRFLSEPDNTDSKTVSYIFGDETVRTAEGNAYHNGKIYICFDDLADYLSMSVSGNNESRKFVIITDNGWESVTFEVGNANAEISGQKVVMGGESILRGDNLWVPLEFVNDYIYGITVTEEKNSVTIEKTVNEELTTKKETVYKEITFLLKNNDPIPSLSGDDAEAQKVVFTADLSAYEEYMVPQNPEEYLILVNSENAVDASLKPEDLTAVEGVELSWDGEVYIRQTPAMALSAMLIEMKACGYPALTVTSSYRSYEEQAELFRSYVDDALANNPGITEEEAENIALETCARPGTSEHQTGLCVDMYLYSEDGTEFVNTPTYKWMQENAWKFGFIERYPNGKTDITKISFEPWHWRFVGRNAAKKIHDNGYCLEEYFAEN